MSEQPQPLPPPAGWNGSINLPAEVELTSLAVGDINDRLNETQMRVGVLEQSGGGTTLPDGTEGDVLTFTGGAWVPEALPPAPTTGASATVNVGPNEAYSIASLAYNRGVTFSLSVIMVSGVACQIVSGHAIVREEAGVGYIGHIWLDQQGQIVAELLGKIGIARDGSDQAPFVLYVRSTGARTLNCDVVAQQGATNVARALAYCIPTSGVVEVDLG
jgi:hypothetical protein